ncbi:MAG: hypothetical protein GY940_38340 [bacterium]|nr:hypothetical protein [bacterium]
MFRWYEKEEGQKVEDTVIERLFYFIDEKNRQRYEMDYSDSDTGVIVKPVFIQTGTP